MMSMGGIGQQAFPITPGVFLWRRRGDSFRCDHSNVWALGKHGYFNACVFLPTHFLTGIHVSWGEEGKTGVNPHTAFSLLAMNVKKKKKRKKN